MIAYAAAERVNAGLASLEQASHRFSVHPRWPLTDVAI